jgi:hypothetical protein
MQRKNRQQAIYLVTCCFRMSLKAFKVLKIRVGTFGAVVKHLNLQLMNQNGEKLNLLSMEKVLSKYYWNRLSGPFNTAIEDAVRASAGEGQCAVSQDKGARRQPLDPDKGSAQVAAHADEGKKKVKKRKRKKSTKKKTHVKMTTTKKKKKAADLQTVRADHGEGSNANAEQLHQYLATCGTRTDELDRMVAVLTDWGASLTWEPSANFENHEHLDAFQLRVHALDAGLRVFGQDTLDPRYAYMAGMPVGEEVQKKPEKLSGKGTKKFVCHQCPGKYEATRSLRRHQKTHGRALVGIDASSHSSLHAGRFCVCMCVPVYVCACVCASVCMCVCVC